MSYTTQWVRLIQVTGLKLAWLKTNLSTLHIGNRVTHTISGTWVEVEEERFVEAWTLLGQPVGELHLGVSEPTITFADLHDDHEAFALTAAELVGAPGPELSGQDITFGQNETVRMFDVESSNISALGRINDALYVRFKGGTYYKYSPVGVETIHQLIMLAERRLLGDKQSSVGSYFHEEVRKLANEGIIECKRWSADEQWRAIPKAF